MTGSPRRRAAVVAALVLALVTVLVACGIPRDREPQKLARRLTPDTEPLQPPGTARTRTQTVYLVRAEAGDGSSQENLEAVRVAVEDPANLDNLPRVVLEQLLREPTQAEVDEGLVTRIPRATRINSVSPVDAGTITVDLDGIDAVEGGGQRLAFAQIVFTLTQLPLITEVHFRVNGQDVPVPIQDGTSEPGETVNRSSYQDLSAIVAAAETTTTTAG